jgi:hypothetical protein
MSPYAPKATEAPSQVACRDAPQLDSSSAIKGGLFDHFVGSDEKRCRNG